MRWLSFTMLLFFASSGAAQAVGPEDSPGAAAPLTYRTSERASWSAETPIVILLHGLGDNARGFEAFVERLDLPYRTLVVNAPRLYGQGPGRSWYRVRDPNTVVDVAESTAQLLALIRQVRARWPQAPAPFLLGFSQGAVMAFQIAGRHPQAIRGAVAIAGYLIPEEMPIEGVRPPLLHPPLLVLHGESDEVVRIARGERAVHRFRERGFEVDWITHRLGHKVPRVVSRSARHWLIQQAE